MSQLHRFLKEGPLQGSPRSGHTSGGMSYRMAWDGDILTRIGLDNSVDNPVGQKLFRHRLANFPETKKDKQLKV